MKIGDKVRFLSETGGLGYKEKDHFDYPTFFGHRTSKTKNEYNKKFKKLYEKHGK